MTENKIVSFPYRGEILKGTIKRMNKKTVTVETDKLLFRVPYSLLSPKIKPPKTKQITQGWSVKQISDYKKSQSSTIDTIPEKQIKVLHLIVKMLEKALQNGKEEAIKEYSNKTVAELNRVYKLPQLSVYTGGKRRMTRRGGQYYGVYKSRGDKEKKHTISVYSRTAKTQKYVAPKTFLRTLVHEWGHHYDRYKLNIKHTYHTKGFYDRINTIYTELKKPLDQ